MRWGLSGQRVTSLSSLQCRVVGHCCTHVFGGKCARNGEGMALAGVLVRRLQHHHRGSLGEGQLDSFSSDSATSGITLLRILPSLKLPVTNVAFGSIPAHQLLAVAPPKRVNTGYRLPLPSCSQRRPADVSAGMWECPRSESNRHAFKGGGFSSRFDFRRPGGQSRPGSWAGARLHHSLAAVGARRLLSTPSPRGAGLGSA